MKRYITLPVRFTFCLICFIFEAFVWEESAATALMLSVAHMVQMQCLSDALEAVSVQAGALLANRQEMSNSEE